jgi:hypothetical protein
MNALAARRCAPSRWRKAPARALGGLECVSRKKYFTFTGAVFVIYSQPLDTPEENPCTYGQGVSEPTIYGYVEGNPIDQSDPLGLQGGPINLGHGWTGRLDPIPKTVGGFEIHVFDPKGAEAGMYGKDGWFNKHGHKGHPANCPTDVENQLNGQKIDYLRRAGVIPPKGTVDIKKIIQNSRRGGEYTNNYPTLIKPE